MNRYDDPKWSTDDAPTFVGDGRNPEREFWERICDGLAVRAHHAQVVAILSVTREISEKEARERAEAMFGAMNNCASLADALTDEWLKRWGAEGSRR